MLVKICGLTNRDDALHAVNCGADYVGFVQVKGSKRYISESVCHEVLASDIVAERSVAVFGPYAGETTSCRFVQGFLERDKQAGLDFGVVRPRSVEEFDLARNEVVGVRYLTIDGFSENEYGGSGHTVDWSLAARIVAESPVPVFLAGGLNCENVVEAIAAVRPHGVDVSSGVERALGVKDHDLVARFIELAKSAAES